MMVSVHLCFHSSPSREVRSYNFSLAASIVSQLRTFWVCGHFVFQISDARPVLDSQAQEAHVGPRSGTNARTPRWPHGFLVLGVALDLVDGDNI